MNFQIVSLFRYDYVVFDCGYINRLYKHADDMIEQTTIEGENGEDENALMFFIDHDYNRKTKKSTYKCVPYQKDEDGVYESLLNLIQEGKLDCLQAVCFKNMDLDVSLLEMLIEYRHCACFGSPYEVASFKTKTGKTVLYQKFDTESG